MTAACSRKETKCCEWCSHAVTTAPGPAATREKGFGLLTAICVLAVYRVRIRPPHTIASLKLPVVPAGHSFGLPPGSLTRAGTLSAPPPYSEAAPREPSSHSSSVAGQPTANFHQYVYRDPARGVRVMTTQQAAMHNGIYGGVSGANSAVPASGQLIGLSGANGANGAEANPRRLGPSRRASAGINGMPKAGAYKPPLVSPPAAESSAAPRALRRPSSRGNVLTSTPEASVPSPSPQQQHFRSTSFSSAGSPATTSFPSGANAAAGLPAHRRRNTSDDPGRAGANGGSVSPPLASPSAPLAMPSTALVIGPGVQGRFGNTPAEPVSQSIQHAEYGNVKHFASFTAAGGEVRPAASGSKPSERASEAPRAGAPEGHGEPHASTLAQTARESAAAIAAERARGKRKGSYDPSGPGEVALVPAASPPLASPPLLENDRDARTRAAADAADRRAALQRAQAAQEQQDGEASPSIPSTSKRMLPDGDREVHTDGQNRTQQEIDEQLANDAALALALSQENEEAVAVSSPIRHTEALPHVTSQKRKTSRPSMHERPSTGTSASAGSQSVSHDRRSDARSRSYSNGARSSQTGGTAAIASFDRYVDAEASQEHDSLENSAVEAGKRAAPKSNAAGTQGRGMLSRLGSSNSDKPNALTSADRKFLARRASLDREVARQQAAEAMRKKELEKSKRRKEEAERKEVEEKRKEKYAKQWEVWEEVRRRERKAGLPPPDVVERDVH